MDIAQWPDLVGPTSTLKNVEFEGLLVKGTGMRARKRYFVLDGVSLQYFATEEMTDLKGEVDVRDAQLSVFSGTTAKGFFFELLVPTAEPGSLRRLVAWLLGWLLGLFQSIQTESWHSFNSIPTAIQLHDSTQN